jgi:pimeloyl-ACP methyl ester carboxylesterase
MSDVRRDSKPRAEERAMKKAKLNGVELEYEIRGSGEPVLLIGTGPIADGFLPFAAESALAERFRLIRYHQRGQVGSTRGRAPVSFAEHAADAALLLGHLDMPRAHVAGHSTGGAIALQLAIDVPEVVHTLALLEPSLMSVPSGGAFFEKCGPALAAYASGEREGAMAGFLSVVSSLEWERCRTVIERHVPGGVAQAMKDADTFFTSYLPALQAWEFGAREAATISCPVLSILGTRSERLFAEGRDLLHSWFPQVEDCTVEGIGHLLHMEHPDPVVRAVTAFFARHPIGDELARKAVNVGAHLLRGAPSSCEAICDRTVPAPPCRSSSDERPPG